MEGNETNITLFVLGQKKKKKQNKTWNFYFTPTSYAHAHYAPSPVLISYKANI